MRLGISTASWMLPNSLRIRLLAVASRALPTDFALVAICDCLASKKPNRERHRDAKRPRPTVAGLPQLLNASRNPRRPIRGTRCARSCPSRTEGCDRHIGLGGSAVNARSGIAAGRKHASTLPLAQARKQDLRQFGTTRPAQDTVRQQLRGHRLLPCVETLTPTSNSQGETTRCERSL